MLGIQQTLAQFIAENFVRKTRFDPLHEAGSEQRLIDQLPTWLSELQQAEAVTLSFQFGERELQLEMERAQLIAAAEPHYLELLRLVQNARVAGMPIELRVSQRVAAMPGLLDRLRTLRDCTIQVLPPAAAAVGRASVRNEYSTAARTALALVYQLPVPLAETDGAGVVGCRSDTAAAAADACFVSRPRLEHHRAAADHWLGGRRRQASADIAERIAGHIACSLHGRAA